MLVNRERQPFRDAAIKAFDELFAAGVVDGRRAQTAILILERHVKPIPPALSQDDKEASS